MGQENECQMPGPTPEHLKLMEGVGMWDVKTKHFMEPGKPPMEGVATDHVEAIGGFWTTSKFTTTMMGQPFVGQCTLGYDVVKKTYIMTWVDSMSHFMFNFEGGFDKAGKVLTLSGIGPDMTGQGMTKWTAVNETIDKNSMLFKMFITMPFGECQIMENTYTRRK